MSEPNVIEIILMVAGLLGLLGLFIFLLVIFGLSYERLKEIHGKVCGEDCDK